MATGNGSNASAVPQGRRQKRGRSELEKFYRKLRWLSYKSRKVLPFRAFLKMVVSHNLFYLADRTVTFLGESIFDETSRHIPGWRGASAPVMVVITGLQQTHWSGYPATWLLAKVCGFDTYVFETPPNADQLTVAEMVDSDTWLYEVLEGKSFFLYTFSRGGFVGLHWLIRHGLTKRCLHFFGMSVPLRGTPMGTVPGTRGARELLPGTTTVLATQTLLHHLHDEGLAVTLMGAVLWDLISPRSTSRPENIEGFKPPPWPRVFWPTLKCWLRGRLYRPPGAPWYWCHSVPQFGHTALYNPVLTLHIGVRAVHMTRERDLASQT